ncbi:MAG TPA: MobF family relaxase [Rhodanobacteraceae bacterium]
MTAKLRKLGSAGSAYDYYSERDDYYLSDRSAAEWHGRGAALLGLTGAVDPHDFHDVLEGIAGSQRVGKPGYHVVTDKDGKAKKVPWHQPGNDFVFSAPKSFSVAILVDGDKQLLAAHDRAVRVALDYAEKVAAVTRQRDGAGGYEWRNTGRLVSAVVRHSTSRDGDPQVHSHAVTANMTYDEATGKWVALDPRAGLYASQKEIGNVYMNELARGAREAGRKIEWHVDEKGNVFAELADVPEAECDLFSSRRKEIIAELIAHGLDPETASAKARQAASLATRSPKEHLPGAELHARWEAQARAAGFEVGNRPDPATKLTDAERSAAAGDAVDAAMESISERETRFTSRQLIAEATTYAQGKASQEDLAAAVADAHARGDLIDRDVQARGHDGSFESVPGYTTMAGAAIEESMLARAGNLAGKPSHLALDPESINQVIAAREKANGHQFTAEQRGAVEGVLSGKDGGFTLIQGFAGTAKTTSDHAAIADAAKAAHIRVRAIAPTHSAANTLATTLGTDYSTVAAINAKALDRDGRPEIWIVDEAGMVSAKDMRDLLRKADLNGAQVILSGDVRQIGSVGAGAALKQLQDAQPGHTHELTDIKRQRVEKLKGAVYASIKGNFKDALAGVGTVERESRDEAVATIAAAYARSVKAGKETLVVTLSNADRLEVDAAIQAQRVADGEVSDVRTVNTLHDRGMTEPERRDAARYRVGDVVQANRNYKNGPQRGEHATVTGVRGGVVATTLDDGRQWRFHPEQVGAKLSVLEPAKAHIGTGDRIVARGNVNALDDKGEAVQIRNGMALTATGTDHDVDTVDGDGKPVQGAVQALHATLDDGRQVTIDTRHGATVDLAYAQTANSAQGLTVDRAIGYMRSTQRNLADRQHAYVTLSRAREAVMLVTDDRGKLADTLAKSAHGKQTALLANAEAEREPAPATKEPVPASVPVDADKDPWAATHVDTAGEQAAWSDPVPAATEPKLDAGRPTEAAATAAAKAVADATADLSGHNARFAHDRLVAKAKELAGWKKGMDGKLVAGKDATATEAEIKQAVSVARKFGKLLDRDVAGFRGVQPGYTTPDAVAAETDMLRHADALAAREPHAYATPRGQVQKRIAEREADTGRRLDVAQTSLLRSVLGGSRRSLSIVDGSAGSERLRDTLAVLGESARDSGVGVRAIAQSRDEAQRLAELTGGTASTVLGMKDRPLDRTNKREVWIAGNANALDASAMRDLLHRADNAGAQVVLVGDRHQLESAGAGAAFEQLAEHAGGRVRRIADTQRDHAPELEAALEAADKGDFKTALKHVDVRTAQGDDAMLRKAADAYMESAHNGDATPIITLNGKDRDAVDVAVQRARIEAGEVSATRRVPNAKTSIGVGERVTVTMKQGAHVTDMTDPAHPVNTRTPSGAMTVESFGDGNELHLRDGNGRALTVDPKQASRIEPAYATTLNRAARGQQAHPIAYLPSKRAMDRRTGYTVLAGARNGATIITDNPGKLAERLGRSSAKQTAMLTKNEVAAGKSDKPIAPTPKAPESHRKAVATALATGAGKAVSEGAKKYGKAQAAGVVRAGKSVGRSLKRDLGKTWHGFKRDMDSAFRRRSVGGFAAGVALAGGKASVRLSVAALKASTKAAWHLSGAQLKGAMNAAKAMYRHGLKAVEKAGTAAGTDRGMKLAQHAHDMSHKIDQKQQARDWDYLVHGGDKILDKIDRNAAKSEKDIRKRTGANPEISGFGKVSESNRARAGREAIQKVREGRNKAHESVMASLNASLDRHAAREAREQGITMDKAREQVANRVYAQRRADKGPTLGESAANGAAAVRDKLEAAIDRLRGGGRQKVDHADWDSGTGRKRMPHQDRGKRQGMLDGENVANAIERYRKETGQSAESARPAKQAEPEQARTAAPERTAQQAPAPTRAPAPAPMTTHTSEREGPEMHR